MMSKYERAPIVESQYNAPSVPRNSVVEARAGRLSRLSLGQVLAERSLRVRQGGKHIDLSVFQNGRQTVAELYLARHVQKVNSGYHREVIVIREQALSSSNCTEVICTSCGMIILSFLPQDWMKNWRNILLHIQRDLIGHFERCSKVCGTCGVSCRVLAREGQNSAQIGSHLRSCKVYSTNLARYAEYVAASGTFEVTRSNCVRLHLDRGVLHLFTRNWLQGNNKSSTYLSRQRRGELEIEVPGALEYFREKNEKEKKKKEEALALPSYKCRVCGTKKKLPSQGSVSMKCSVCEKVFRINTANWVEIEEEESDKKLPSEGIGGIV